MDVSNSKLVSEDRIELLTQLLSEQPDGRYSKAALRRLAFEKLNIYLDIEYGIVKRTDSETNSIQLFAIYKGATQEKELGAGAFGVVKLTQDLTTGDFVVLKINKSNTPPSMIYSEVVAMWKMDVLLFQFEYDSLRKGNEYIVGMKIAKGNELWKLIGPESNGLKNPKDNFNPLQRLMFAKGVLKSTKDAHARGIIHRDIKPDNFVCDPGTCKIELVDWGMAKPIQGKKDQFELYDSKVHGTAFYMAPELIDMKQATVYNEKTEVYALGQTIGNIFGLTKEAAPVGKYFRQEIVSAMSSQFRENDRLPSNPNSRLALLNILTEMTDPNPDLRPSITTAYSRINKLLKEEYKAEFKVGVIHLQEFENLSSSAQEKLIQKMRKEGITAFALADPLVEPKDNLVAPQIDMQSYYKIRQILEKNNILNIAPVVFHGSKNEAEQEAGQYFQSHFQARPVIYSIGKEVKHRGNLSKIERFAIQEKKITSSPSVSSVPSLLTKNTPKEPTSNPSSWRQKFAARTNGMFFSHKNNSNDANMSIQNDPYYHGSITSKAAQDVLSTKKDGSFLLRFSQEEQAYILNLKLGDQIKEISFVQADFDKFKKTVGTNGFVKDKIKHYETGEGKKLNVAYRGVENPNAQEKQSLDPILEHLSFKK
ncbi:MAG: protein kinase [Gammaproteobacteria bacterium]|nr:protein kinase [Gammaproteobacteria bacterium]